MLSRLALASPLPSRLDSITLTITRWFTNGMYIQLKNNWVSLLPELHRPKNETKIVSFFFS